MANMSELFLIAHRVRGAPAFDVAIRMACPQCMKPHECETYDGCGCIECDSLGYWWIIPTSGHRAYPWWNQTLEQVSRTSTFVYSEDDLFAAIPPMPEGWPDHYPTASTPKVDLAQMLGIGKPKPAPTNFKRRI